MLQGEVYARVWLECVVGCGGCGGCGVGCSVWGGMRRVGCAPESLVPHDHDQPSERAEIVGQLLADPEVEEKRVHRLEKPAAPQIEQVGSGCECGEGEGPTRVRG